MLLYSYGLLEHFNKLFQNASEQSHHSTVMSDLGPLFITKPEQNE